MIISMKALGRYRDNSSRMVRRQHRPTVEAMEPRTLLTFNFNTAIGVGAEAVVPQKPAVDAAGNIYVTGNFKGDVNFNPYGTTDLNSGNTSNIFVAKYTSTGSLVWVDQFADDESLTSGLNTGTTVAVDNEGDVYVTGTYAGSVNFSTNPANPDYHKATTQEVFVVKLDSGGNRQAFQSFGGPWTVGNSSGTGSGEGTNIAVNAAGNDVVVDGYFQGSVDFNPGGNNLTDVLNAANGTNGAFALDLDGGLDHAWERNLGYGASAIATGVALDSYGDVYIIGTFTGAGNFDPDPNGGSYEMNANGAEREFVQKLGASGNFIAAGVFGQVPTFPISGFMETPTIAVDAQGNAYATGLFQGEAINFNPASGSTDTQDSAGGTIDGFVLKLNSSLGFVWDTRIGGSVIDGATGISDLTTGIAVDGAGNVYVGGVITAAATVGPTTSSPVIYPLNAASTVPDAFVAEFNSGGGFVNAQVGGGGAEDMVFGVAANAAGDVAIVGTYSQQSQFGSFTTPQFGPINMFVAGLGSSTPTTPSPTSPSPTSPSPTSPSPTSPSPTSPTSTSISAPVPVLIGDQVMFSGRGKNRKITGVQLFFSGVLDFGSASNTGNYRLTQKVKKKTRALPVLAASYDSGNNSVTLLLGKSQKGAALQLAISGLRGVNGSPMATDDIGL